MLKRLVNEARFTLRIKTEGPLLIKTGHATPWGEDMTPVKTYRNGDWEVFIPGSSLKGVIRSHLEKVVRTLRADTICCNPFLKLAEEAHNQGGNLACPNYADVFCGDKFEARSKDEVKLKSDNSIWHKEKDQNLDNPVVYADSCPICRLFGSTSYIGRVSIGDAYLIGSEHTEKRDGVGIDRLTGGAANRAKFDLEAVSSDVTFQTDIHLRNFECWQLGMLMVVVQDLQDKLIRLGSGRSRGLGAVSGEVTEVSIAHLGNVNGKPASEIWGLGKFLDGSGEDYGTNPDDMLTVQTAPTEARRGIRQIATFAGDSLTALQEAAIADFVARMQVWSVPNEMQWAHLQLTRR